VWLGGSKSCLINGKAAFKRIFIRRRQQSENEVSMAAEPQAEYGKE
jgi:hypothetical protein